MEQKIRSELLKMTLIMVVLIGLGVYAHEFVISGIKAKAALNLSIFAVFALAAALAFRHVLGLEIGGFQVDRHHRVKILTSGVKRRAMAGHARGIEQHIKRAMVGNKRRQGIKIRHVQPHGGHAIASITAFPRQIFKLVGTARHGVDFRPRFRQRHRTSGSDAGGSAGHQCFFAIKTKGRGLGKGHRTCSSRG